MDVGSETEVDPLSDPTTILARRCAGIRDARVRFTYVGSFVRRSDPRVLVDLLSGAQAGAGRIPAYNDLLLALSLALSGPHTERLRREAAMVAVEMGLSAVVELLGQQDQSTPEFGELRVPDFGTGRPLTLGERKTLARKRDRTLVARVLRDPHPDVIKILLDNPALTELDIIRLAARRPIDPESLRQIFLNPRWAVRYAIRGALIQNSYCPLDVALRIAPLLNATDSDSRGMCPNRSPVRTVGEVAALDALRRKERPSHEHGGFVGRRTGRRGE